MSLPDKQLADTIGNFLTELSDVTSKGYVLDVCDILHKYPGDEIKKIGVEIMFDSSISHDKIKRIKKYIEQKYNFYVDVERYYTTNIKIVMVRYLV